MNQKIIKNTLLLVVSSMIVSLLLFTNQSAAAEIKVSLDRDVIPVDDSFTVTFQVTGSVDADPDFSPLQKDFRLLSNHRRSNFTIINGQRNSTLEWLVELKARRQGVLEIPAIRFGTDLSPAKEITIKSMPATAKQDEGDVFVEVEAFPETTWVQSQVLLTIRLFRAINTFNSSLSEPEISGGKMIVEKLEDRQFETSRNNRRYIVLERRYALFPQASGEMIISPVIFEGQYSQRSRNLFDPFAQNSRTIQRSSKEITLQVDPIPAGYKAATWLPARKLQLSEKWMKDDLQLVVGEPVTRVVVIKAEGLTAEQLPELATSEVDSFKIYPDQPELSNQTNSDGLLGIRQEKSAVIPNVPGEYVLPAVQLPWWNTRTGKMEIAELPERMITVLPAAGKKTVDLDSQISEAAESAVTDLDLTSTPTVPLQGGSPLWFWLSVLLGLGWLITLFLWWKQTHQSRLQTDQKKQPTERNSLRSIRNGVRTKDPVLIKEALLEWGRALWQENPPANLAELGARTDLALAEEIAQLNQALYGKNESKTKQWDVERLLIAVENYEGLRLRRKKSHNLDESTLKPLYKIS